VVSGLPYLAIFFLTPGALSARLDRRAGAALANNRTNRTLLGKSSIESIPMIMYKQDCFKKKPVLLEAGSRVKITATLFPGVGMEPSKYVPFQTVLKDGYYNIACAKDYMYYFGDKFGDNKWDYKLGEVSNVSIVLYDSIIDKKDREPMSPAVCFGFCRTVPDMLFFGITNGRSCYCMPYFKQMESDNSQCDATCEGDLSLTCGSKTKTAIFEMHMCNQITENLQTANENLLEVGQKLFLTGADYETAAKDLKGAAEAVQALFGQVGDPVASDLAQTAKVDAGRMLETSGEAQSWLGHMKDLFLVKKNQAKNDVEIEEVTREIEEANAKADVMAQELDTELRHLPDSLMFQPTSSDQMAEVLPLYKNTMYFVDKEFVNDKASCGGKLIGTVATAGSAEACAKACEEKFQECVGFTLLNGGSKTSLCALFSKFTSIQYYPSAECPNDAPRLVQPAMCMAKFSEFSGTTIKPDSSGKCAGCLTTATKADRCIPAAGAR